MTERDAAGAALEAAKGELSKELFNNVLQEVNKKIQQQNDYIKQVKSELFTLYQNDNSEEAIKNLAIVVDGYGKSIEAIQSKINEIIENIDSRIKEINEKVSVSQEKAKSWLDVEIL